MASNFLRLTLIGRDQSASSTVDALTRRVRIAGATISGIGQKVSGAGKSLSLGVTAPLAGIAAVGVKTEAEFSRTMAQVAVATNLPASKLKGLSDYALEMGAKTTFSAGEASQAMLNLAKGGFTPAQIKGGALASTMNLAAAGGLSLDEAATDVVSSMNTFNLTADQSGKIADALAGAANASSADVSDLAMALSQGGAAAKSTKQSIGDTAGFLGLLADNAVRGSDAGTSMKTFLLGLVPNSKAAAKEMRGLGLSFADSKGHIDKLPTVAAKLQAAFKGMGDDERIAAEKQMFGNDAFRAAEALYNAGPAGLKKYADAARGHGNAEKMAAAQMSGTAGATEAMRGSLETAALTIGQTLAPTVIMLSGKVTELANWFSGLDSDTRKTLVTLALVAAAIGPVLFVTGKLITGVGSTVSAFANARTAATNFGLGLRSASAAGSATTGLAGTIGGAVRTAATGFASGTAAAARWAAATAAAGARAAASAVAAGARVVGTLVVQGAAYAAAGARAAASVAVQVAIRGAQLAMAAATGIATVAQWALNAAMTANPIGIVVVAIAALVAGLVWFFSQTKLGQQIWSGFVGFLSSAWNGFVGWFQGALNTVVGFFRQWGPLILAVIAPFIGLPLLIISNWGKITAWFGRLPGVIGGLVAGAGKWLISAGGKILGGLLEGAKAGLVALGRWELSIGTAIVGWVSGAGKWLVDTGVTLLTGLITGAKAGLVALGRWELGIVTSVVGWVSGAGAWLVNTGVSLLRGLASGAIRGYAAVRAFLGGLAAKVTGALSGAASWLLSVGRNVIAGLVGGIRNAAGAVVSAISGVVRGAIDTAKRLLGIASPSRVFRQIGAFVGAGLIKGLQGTGDQVASAMQSLREKVVSAFQKLGDQREAAQKRIHKLDQQLKNVDEHTKAGKARAKAIRQMLAAEQAELISVNRASTVKKSALLAQLVAETKNLEVLAKRRDRLAEKLKDAQDRLEEARKTRDDYASNVAGSAVEGGNVASAFGTARSEASDAASTAADYRSKLADLDESVGNIADDRQTLLDKLANVQQRRATAVTTAGQIAASNQILTLTQQLSNLDQRVADYQGDRAALVAKMDAAEATSRRSPVAILVDNLRAQVAKVGQFRALLGQLKSQGLDDTSYAQLVGAGVDGGLETAQALATDQTGAVGQIAALQGQLATAAGQLGTSTSTQLYQAGVDSAKALTDSLKGQVTVVTGAMGVVEQEVARSVGKLGVNTSGLMRSAGHDIADGLRIGVKDKRNALSGVFDDLGDDMVRTLKKKLGIKSPSTVFHGIGLNTTEGARLGILAGAGGVQRAISGLIPTDVYSTPVTVGAAAGGSRWGAPSGPAGGGPMVHIENFHAGGLSADEVAAAWAWKSRWPS